MSPERDHANANGVAAALTDARVVLLPGQQQHIATHTWPDLFVSAVVRFLQDPLEKTSA